MQLPTTDDVNTTRLARFDNAITTALGDSAAIDEFRDIVAHYVRNHNVPEADVAAALAVVAQGGTPLLLDAENDKLAAALKADDRPQKARKERASDGGAPKQRRSKGDFAPYRIEVGRRNRVEPRQIVGALANEGGFSRDDFCAINIRPDFTIVELPANIDPAILAKLQNTRVAGRPIEIKPDRGPRGGGKKSFGARDDFKKKSFDKRDSFDDRPQRKPRHKG